MTTMLLPIDYQYYLAIPPLNSIPGYISQNGPLVIFLLIISFYIIVTLYHTLLTSRNGKSSYAVRPVPSFLPFGIDVAFTFAVSFLRNEMFTMIAGHMSLLGHTAEYRMMGTQLVITDDPENIKSIMSARFADWGKGKILKGIWNDLLGDSIFTADGHSWELQKNSLQPHLAKNRSSDLRIAEQHMRSLLSKIHEKGYKAGVNVSELMTQYSLGLVTDVFLGERQTTSKGRSSAEFSKALDRLMSLNSMRTIFGPLGLLFPTIFLRSDILTIHEYINERIQRVSSIEVLKRDDGQNLSLVDALHSTNADNDDIKNQLIAVLIAGREPIAISLAWTLYELSRNPEILRKLRAEIVNSIGLNHDPTYAELGRMSYLQNIIKETFRMYPSLGINMRTALVDTELPHGGGPDSKEPVLIAKGTRVVYSVLCTQRRPELVGSDAHIFNPDRWDNWKGEKWTYAPFNHGPRTCLGRSFAICQIAYVLVRLFQEFETVELENGDEMKLKFELNVKPAKPVICRFG
ncbi:cytochrome P450 [Xylogone sp. PMI_703]|nr:cytochrome P450 [Xylogone sp. PMI_703]